MYVALGNLPLLPVYCVSLPSRFTAMPIQHRRQGGTLQQNLLRSIVSPPSAAANPHTRIRKGLRDHQPTILTFLAFLDLASSSFRNNSSRSFCSSALVAPLEAIILFSCGTGGSGVGRNVLKTRLRLLEYRNNRSSCLPAALRRTE